MKPIALLQVLISGMLFGLGLTYATMVQPEVVLSFLNFNDFGLLLVLGGATTLTFVVYQLVPRIAKAPLFATKFSTRPANERSRTLLGALIFGVGWGLSGVCPGPAIASVGAGNWPVLYALGGMFVGAYIQGRFFSAK
jgi:uncharacterized membrane protein YedE/YeeE